MLVFSSVVLAVLVTARFPSLGTPSVSCLSSLFPTLSPAPHHTVNLSWRVVISFSLSASTLRSFSSWMFEGPWLLVSSHSPLAGVGILYFLRLYLLTYTGFLDTSTSCRGVCLTTIVYEKFYNSLVVEDPFGNVQSKKVWDFCSENRSRKIMILYWSRSPIGLTEVWYATLLGTGLALSISGNPNSDSLLKNYFGNLSLIHVTVISRH